MICGLRPFGGTDEQMPKMVRATPCHAPPPPHAGKGQADAGVGAGTGALLRGRGRSRGRRRVLVCCGCGAASECVNSVCRPRIAYFIVTINIVWRMGGLSGRCVLAACQVHLVREAASLGLVRPAPVHSVQCTYAMLLGRPITIQSCRETKYSGCVIIVTTITVVFSL